MPTCSIHNSPKRNLRLTHDHTLDLTTAGIACDMVNGADVPQDVLITVFECVAGASWAPPGDKELLRLCNIPTPFPWVNLHTIMSISHVCKRWREAIIATSLCWSTVMVDFDELKHDDFRMKTSRIESQLKRARKRPLTIIFKNDRRVVPDEIPLSFTGLLAECVTNANRVYARLLTPHLVFSLVGMLSEVPNLEFLALWHVRRFEVLNALGLHVGIGWTEDFLPPTYLQNAPLLRTIYTRGVPYPDPDNGPLPLPHIGKLVVDDTSSSVVSLLDYTSFLRTFANVTSLALLIDGWQEGLLSGNQVLFPALEHLEMGGGAAYVFFSLSQQVHAPKLRDLCLHLHYLRHENHSLFLQEASAALRSSTAVSKCLILDGFASEIRDASHIRCLQVIELFKFVEFLEFRGSVFRFPIEWNTVWRGSEPRDWETLFEMECFLNAESSQRHSDSDINDDEETRSASLEADSMPSAYFALATEQENEIPPGYNIVISLNQHTTAEASWLPAPTVIYSRYNFMPQLRGILFHDCLFPDNDGAAHFADTLAVRQKHLKTMSDGSQNLEKVELLNVTGSGSRAFVDALTRSNVSDTM